MSLISIIGNTTQSLINTQTQIGVVSENVANAQNPGYARRDATLVDQAGGGQVVDVSRAVDQSLQQALLGQTAESAGQSFLDQLYQQLEQLAGSASGSPSLSSASQALLTAFQDYAAQPESTSAQTEVMQAVEGLVNAVHDLASGIETIAAQVQSQAQSDVQSLNGNLAAIATLNRQIVAAKATGQPTAQLEDQRDAAVNAVAKLAPVSLRENPDGSIRLATPDGVTLVDGATASQFAYTPYTLGSNGTAGTDAKITLVGDASGTSLNASLAGGQLGAELSALRVDDAGAASSDPSVAPLEKLRRQLDAFADQFYSSNPATPTAFQSAYNGASTDAGSTELASDLFLVQNQGPGGQPQPAASDRFGFELNPALLSGAATLKPSAATPVAEALAQASAAAPLSAGDVQNFSGTIGQLADAIAAAQSQRAAAATADTQQGTASLNALQTSYSNSTGVSVDSQLAELIVLQNSFNAAAKVISISNSISQSLQYAIFGS